MRTRVAGLSVLLLAPMMASAQPPANSAGANDWPQWRGSDRTHVSRETGLLKKWPAGGPSLAWRVRGIGEGYSTPSIAQGMVFVMGNVEGEECLIALNEQDGQRRWQTPLGRAGEAGGFAGPRSTPTVDGDRTYALGVRGTLVCVNTKDGSIIWRKDLPREFGGEVGAWGYCESVLIDGDALICTPGGQTSMAKLNKADGEVIWKSQVPGNDRAEYSSPIIAEVGGVKQYIQFMSGGVIAVAAKDGTFLWRYQQPRNGTANCSTPIFRDNHVFAASAYGTGGGLAKITGGRSGFKAEQVYFTKSMKNHHGGMVLVKNHIFGANDPGLLTCIDFKTGKVKWEERSTGKGAVSYADDRLYFRNEGSGELFLVEANTQKFVLHGRLKQPDRSGKNAWAHPVIANGRLYLCDQDLMLVYDIKE